nr:nodulation-signaling pathway 1 protein [Ipomoea trifida]
MAGNMNWVQHLLYVLSELASLTGDANHRLATHGLQVLTHHLGSGSSFAGVLTFCVNHYKILQGVADDFQRHKFVVSHPKQLRELVDPPGSSVATGPAQILEFPMKSNGRRF